MQVFASPTGSALVADSLSNPYIVPNCATASGTDTITAIYTPVITTTPDQMILFFVAAGANTTTTPTFSPNSLTAHTITKKGGSALAAGDIPAANAVCIIEYNSAHTRWELLNPSVSGASVSDGAYGSGWDGVTSVAPSQNAVYDQMQLQMLKTGSNLAIGSDADGDMYYRALGVLTRLAKGAANLKMFMNAAGTAPEWADGYKIGTFTKTMTDSSTTQAITGVGFKPRMIIFIAAISGTYAAAWGFAIGTTGSGIAAAGTTGYYYHNDINVFVIYSPTSGDSQAAVINSDDADGFTIGWTKSGSPTGTATIQYIAVR